MKIKGMFKRSVAGLLLGVTLFTGYSATYLQAREVKASASATYTLLYTLFEYVMASCGLAVTNKADNEALCDAFCEWLETKKAYNSLSPKEKMDEELKKAALIGAGIRVKLDDFPSIKNAMLEFINSYVKSSSKVKSVGVKSDFFKPGICKHCDQTAYFGSLLEYYGCEYDALPVYCVGTAYYHKKKCSFSYNNVPYSGEVFVLYYATNFYEKKLYPFDNQYYLDSNFYVKSFSDSKISYTPFARIFVFDSDTKELKTSIRISQENFTNLPLSLQKVTAYAGTVFSAEEPRENLSTLASISESLNMVSGIYGNMDSISSSVANITEVIAGQTPLIDSIAQSIADMNSKTLTDEDINKIVEDALSNYKESIDSVKDNTEDTAQNTATTNSWLSKIYSKLNAISKSVSGNNALKLEDDVSSQFKVMEGGDSDPDDDNEPPKIRGIGAFTTVKLLQPVMEAYDISLKTITKWLSKINDTVAYSITQSTQQQIKAQEETTKAVNEVATKIQSLPEEIPLKMPENFPESIPLSIPETLPDLFPKSIPLEIPETFADLFPKSIPLELPENFPESIPLSIPETLPALFPESIPLTMPDLEPSMDLYIGKLQDMVVPDLQPIEESLDKQKKDIEGKLPDLDNVFVFDKYSFDKEYPRIAITTPAIVSAAGYKSPEIVLFDGKDYVNYFVWIRMILDAIIRVGFAYALICKFRVRFTYS